MHKAIVTLAAILTCCVAPSAWSQGWTPSGILSFQQDSEYDLSLMFPAVEQFDSATLMVTYSPQVFNQVSNTSFSSGYYTFGLGDVSVPVASSGHPGFEEILVSMPIGTPIDLSAGSLLLTMNLEVKPDATPGLTKVFSSLEYTTYTSNDPTMKNLAIDTQIAAVPEPAAWTTLLVGMGLLVAYAAFSRRGFSRSQA